MIHFTWVKMLRVLVVHGWKGLTNVVCQEFKLCAGTVVTVSGFIAAGFPGLIHILTLRPQTT